MTGSDRLVGCAVGALVIGLLAAFVGIGPERVLTGLLAVVAATLGGALLDDFIGSRTKSAWASRRGRMPTQPVGQQPFSAPRGTTPARRRGPPTGRGVATAPARRRSARRRRSLGARSTTAAASHGGISTRGRRRADRGARAANASASPVDHVARGPLGQTRACRRMTSPRGAGWPPASATSSPPTCSPPRRRTPPAHAVAGRSLGPKGTYHPTARSASACPALFGRVTIVSSPASDRSGMYLGMSPAILSR